MSYNRILVEGYLGKDPNLDAVKDGTLTRAQFGVANTHKDRNGDETTDWYQCTLFGYKADHAGANLKKGSLVMVEGKLTTSQWVNKDGVNQTSLNILGDRYRILNKGEAVNTDGGGSGTEDDVPF